MGKFTKYGAPSRAALLALRGMDESKADALLNAMRGETTTAVMRELVRHYWHEAKNERVNPYDGYLYFDRARLILAIANKYTNGYGVEAIRSNADADGPAFQFTGLEYVNQGDTYAATLIFDYGKGRFIAGAWGDIVERDKRFQEA